MEREVELLIEDIAFGGKGVGRVEGKAVFVPFTIAGEQVAARIVRQKKSLAQAEVVEVLKASPERVSPPCPYFERCGGCAYQHMTYEHQLHWKSHQVGQALRRVGKFREPPLRPIVPSPREYEYRNRITIHVTDSVVGFFRHDTHRLIDVERCPIAMPEVNDELAALRARRPRDGNYTLRAGRGPRIFSQTNEAVAAHLADVIAELIPSSHTIVIDAYCGAGFFAKRLVAGGNDADVSGIKSRSGRARLQLVIGIDWDIHGIRVAQAEMSDRELYIAGDIATHLREQLLQRDPHLTSVILDPPAIGLSREVREILCAHPVATLLYVSCNPPTLARDLADLASVFQLQSVTPFDMFPQTAEIEALAHLKMGSTAKSKKN